MSKQHQSDFSKYFKHKPIAYNPGLAIIFNSTNAGILLSQLLYWHGKGKLPNGWIFKTIEEMYKETGLTRDQQDTAIKICKNLGILETKRAGVPAKRHFRLDIERLREIIPSLKETHKLTYPNPPNNRRLKEQTIPENTQKTTTNNTVVNSGNLYRTKMQLTEKMSLSYKRQGLSRN